MTTTVRCANCDRYLGESSEPLVTIEAVQMPDETKVDGKRDVRKCKFCRQWTISIPRSEFECARLALSG